MFQKTLFLGEKVTSVWEGNSMGKGGKWKVGRDDDGWEVLEWLGWEDDRFSGEHHAGKWGLVYLENGKER